MAKDSKTIGVTIRFWDVDPSQQKHAWGSGTVYVQANDAHGIKSADSVPFNKMSELLPALEEAVAEAGVTLHLGSPANKVYAE